VHKFLSASIFQLGAYLRASFQLTKVILNNTASWKVAPFVLQVENLKQGDVQEIFYTCVLIPLLRKAGG